MSLTDRAFLYKYVSNFVICQFISNIKIRNIEIKVHNSTKYVIMNLYLSEKIKERSTITHFKKNFHVVNNLKINLLMKIKIINLEKNDNKLRKQNCNYFNV